MTGKPRNPDEEQPAEAQSPGQQMQDSGSSDRGLSGADIDDGEDGPGDNEIGGG
jgi:hypothetical protein